MGSLNTRLWDRATAGYGISQHPAMGPRHTGERGFSAPENGASPHRRTVSLLTIEKRTIAIHIQKMKL
ncbi:hypothetical protein [Parabacteroides bouchesdurhonensis]|uniref:hypothetical protein n=1 Tax=Parabacteroides bouchesdurhonensis TaxID=1936995 RepID=UPI0011C40C84|nr:hypothetical protein [Parabacteroides bouchesdurhonensis]